MSNCGNHPGTGCTDLRELSDGRYRVVNEIEGRRAHRRDEAWDRVLLGRRGSVAPWGHDSRLVACTRATATTKRLLASVPDAVVVQDGSDGSNIAFAPQYLDVVAEVLKLRRKRRYSAAQRQAAAARLAKVRPKPLSRGAVSPRIPPIAPPAGENQAKSNTGPFR